MKQSFKLFSLLAATALTLGFASCSNDSESEGGADNTPKTVAVKLPESAISRAVGSAASAGATTVNDATVFLLNGNSVATSDVFSSTEISNGVKYFQDIVYTVTDVIVVANVPTSEQSAVSALTTKSAIENYAYTVAMQNPSTDTGIDDKILMGSGASVLQATNPITGSTNDYYEASVNLSAITARLEIGDVTAGTGIDNIMLEGVWINNFPATNAVATNTIYDNTNAAWSITPTVTVGSSTAVTPTTIPAYTPSEYQDVYDASVSGTNVYAYHLYAGSYIPYITLLVSGKYTSGYAPATGEDYFMAWVTFTNLYNNTAPTVALTAIEGNKIYKTGDIAINSSYISTTPVPTTYDLGVTVAVANWTVENVTPGL